MFIELAKKRASIRKYKNQPIEKERLTQVLEAARIAPSAKNLQPWHFIIVQDPALREQICTTYAADWLKQAPTIIVVCGDHSRSWRRPDGKDHCDIDIAITIDHMTLAAADMGLGTCWICMFNAMQCHRILQLPSHMEAVALLPIGYPDVTPSERHAQRLPLNELVTWK